MELKDRVAVVTGGSRGIGRAIALELASLGASVVVNYRTSADAADEVVQSIEAEGGRAIAVQADVGEFDQAARLIQAATEAYGRVDMDVPLVVRLDGTNSEEGLRLLREANLEGLYEETTMLGAAEKVVELAGSGS